MKKWVKNSVFLKIYVYLRAPQSRQGRKIHNKIIKITSNPSANMSYICPFGRFEAIWCSWKSSTGVQRSGFGSVPSSDCILLRTMETILGRPESSPGLFYLWHPYGPLLGCEPPEAKYLQQSILLRGKVSVVWLRVHQKAWSFKWFERILIHIWPQPHVCARTHTHTLTNAPRKNS